MQNLKKSLAFFLLTISPILSAKAIIDSDVQKAVQISPK